MLENNKYSHHMIKEIEESPTVIRRIVEKYTKKYKFKFNRKLINALNDAENVYILGCGTSYHSALAGKRFFYNLRAHYKVRVASEWALNPYAHSGKIVYIMISQSGETADLIRCLENIKPKSPLIVITNSPNSTLAKRAHYVLDLCAGEEKAIASTKVYFAQVTVLALLAASLKNDVSTIEELLEIADKQEEIFDNKNQYKELAKYFSKVTDTYILGRGVDYPIALEASLKLKETSYIHSEAFYGGEFKHGPISLVVKNIPTILFLSEKNSEESVRRNQIEIEELGGHAFVLTSRNLEQEGDVLVVPECKEEFSPLLKVMVVQYLAYYLAIEKGLDPDNPRNLSKAVII